MKSSAKKGIIAATLACVSLSSALCLTVGTAHSALAEDADCDDHNLAVCEQRLTTIGSELEGLVAGYNEVYETDWAASEIEYSSPVFIVEDNEYGMYLDFDGNNGYVVMTTDKKIYGLETRGDLQWLRGDRAIYYSYMDGFLYIDGDGQYQKYELEVEVREDEIAKVNNAVLPMRSSEDRTIYPGQRKWGDSKIDPFEVDRYVAARYPGYTLDSVHSMQDNFQISLDFSNSYYKRIYNDGIHSNSDRNGTLNAMFNVMRDWGKRGYIEVPYDTTRDIRESIYDDVFYSTYSKGTKTGEDKIYGAYKWVVSTALRQMPVLYSNIRGYAIVNGYTPEDGYEASKVPETMKYVANFLYDNSLKVGSTTLEGLVAADIDVKRCRFMSIKGSSAYGDCGAAVLGVHIYKKEDGVKNGFTIYDYKYFYEIADGDTTLMMDDHRIEFCVFDPNTSAKPQLEFYFLNLPRC